MSSPHWPCLRLARALGGAPRVPFTLADEGGVERRLGSVAEPDLAALAAWPEAFALTPAGVRLILPPATRDAALASIHQALRDQGRILAWRNEPYPLRDREGGTHGVIERAASRFWGLLTVGAHCNGHLADAQGRPTHLWIARRAATKATDPGRLDNLVGCGVPLGQGPREAVVREGWEEAGLLPAQMAGLQAGGVFELDADIREGRQVEWLHVYDLALPPDYRPQAIDGEVDEHHCLPVAEALARAAAGELTTDASLATLDFGLRHGLLGADAPALQAALDRLRVPGLPG